MKGAQIGISECGNNWIGYVIHHAPGPMLAVLPTVEMAKRYPKQRGSLPWTTVWFLLPLPFSVPVQLAVFSQLQLSYGLVQLSESPGHHSNKVL